MLSRVVLVKHGIVFPLLNLDYTGIEFCFRYTRELIAQFAVPTLVDSHIYHYPCISHQIGRTATRFANMFPELPPCLTSSSETD